MHLFVVHAENPPLNVVRKFVHLLDQSDTDYAEEIGKNPTVRLLRGPGHNSSVGE